MDKEPRKGMGPLDVNRIEGSKPGDEEEIFAGDAIYDKGHSGTRNHYLYSYPYHSQDLNIYPLLYANTISFFGPQEFIRNPL